jgi:hypothetical protein
MNDCIPPQRGRWDEKKGNAGLVDRPFSLCIVERYLHVTVWEEESQTRENEDENCLSTPPYLVLAAFTSTYSVTFEIDLNAPFFSPSPS